MSAPPVWLTPVLVLTCIALAAASLWSARRLLGSTAAFGFAAIALSLGWLAEEMGATRGWFFGRYHYTEVLGPRLGAVPLAIPLMWFAVSWLGLVMARLILWRDPAAREGSWPQRLLTAWLAALIITAFDLGADPYLVYVIGA